MSTFTSNGIEIHFTDNSGEVLRALKNAVNRGLKACGDKAVDYAQSLCPVDTGALRSSIRYQVDGDDVYIGTDKKYAKYVEFGTGVYAENGGRHTPWSYQDAYGNWRTTHGSKAQPFIRPAANNHENEYKDLLRDSLKNA